MAPVTLSRLPQRVAEKHTHATMQQQQYRGRSTESLVVAAFVICLTLFFVNELRMYDKAASQRVAQVTRRVQRSGRHVGDEMQRLIYRLLLAMLCGLQ